MYNRWGEEVFISSNPKVGWDGKYKGIIAQDGLYTYRLYYVSCEITDAIHNIAGHFSLIK